ncbi:hypothetical protein CISG_05133 [Coccidioides immitis RMSCC 3703]|uniref:Uncharacterized protein n=2 Tax=Coccidioides immitis TaxID=5501 RepID=A0A0J8QTW8_COCIT|nr:hypothetical protein CIRG_01361 [Coccidioides immitis RMSCC 2394]KMU75500.1 hypothetical protein CISG_05133 [Coccidioides immitis RMSCC 3703]
MHMQPFPNEYARNNHFREGDEKWFGIKTRFKLFPSQPTVPKTNSPSFFLPRHAAPSFFPPGNEPKRWYDPFIDDHARPSEMPAPLQVPVSKKGKAGREESPAYRTNTGEIDPGNGKF